jgi:hypothetical protein
MKEPGLLFTPENRALVRLQQKTQTRRLMKPQPTWENTCSPQYFSQEKLWDFGSVRESPSRLQWRCPYGNPQAEPVRYYLKEPVRITAIWDARESHTEHGMALIQYTDDNPDDIIECQQHKVLLGPGDFHKLVSRADWQRPSSSLFMLKSFARTWLTGVRTWPERLWDMSDEDALAEGIELDASIHPFEESKELRHQYRVRPVWRDYLNGGYNLTPIQSYASLWNSINGKTHPWNPDLWTWAVEWEAPQC